MEAVNSKSETIPTASTVSSYERIATLEERSQHTATKAELHRALLMMFVALLTTLGGLIIHLHNTTLNELTEIRRVLIELLQQMPGG